MLLRHALHSRLLTFALLMGVVAAFQVVISAPAEAFEDTRGHDWDEAVQALVDADVLMGCREGQFCPVRSVDRGQMASILVRALELEPAEGGRFDDIAGTTHEENINALAEAGITQGCSESSFCPSQSISRAEMATLLKRAFDIPDTDERWFDDIGGVHASSIDAAAAAGVAAGCGQPLTAFCPRDDVQRWQAALFVARAMDLIDRVEVSSLEQRQEEQAQIDADRQAKERELARQEAANNRGQTAADTAVAQVGKPYQWGGNGPGSFDCSGLTSYAWRSAGVEIPRTSRDQYRGTDRISRSQLQPGDLIFYSRDGTASGIGHVAMFIGGGDVVEAPYSGNNVRISSTGLSRGDILGYGRPS